MLTQTEKTKERRRRSAGCFFLHFFFSRRFLYHVTLGVIFFPFRNGKGPLRFWSKKRTQTTHKKQNNQEAIEIFTFYYASYTHNVYRAIRIYDCGKCYVFRVAIFALLVRFNVRIFVRRGVRGGPILARKFCLLSNLFSVVEKKKEDRLPIARDKIVNAESASQWFEDAHEREKRA